MTKEKIEQLQRFNDLIKVRNKMSRQYAINGK